MNFDQNQDEQKSVIIRIEKSEITTLKMQIKKLQEKTPDLKVGLIRVGKLGENYVVSFSVVAKYYDLIIKEMEELGGESMLKEKKSINKISVLKTNFDKPIISPSIKPGEKVNNNPEITLKSAIRDGDYERVIQIARNVRAGYMLMKKAKESIDEAVRNSIAININNAFKNKFKIVESITALIKISSDKNLRALNKVDLMIEAGSAAIKICENFSDAVENLIKIINNNLVPNIIVVKAASKFSEIVLWDKKKYFNDLSYASKNLNIRWLKISLDIVSNKLSEREKGYISNLIGYIETMGQ
jgi:hypothetical protein